MRLSNTNQGLHVGFPCRGLKRAMRRIGRDQLVE